MKTSKKALNEKAARELGVSKRKDISERPIIPSTKTIPTEKDKLKMRKTKASRRDISRRVEEGLSDS